MTEDLVRDAEVVEGCRAIGFTLGTPAVGMLGVVDDVLCDRAFVDERATSAAELGTLADLVRPGRTVRAAAHTSPTRWPPRRWPARTACPPGRCGTACAASRPGAHRIAAVAEVGGVAYVDDSKATNPHAAAASLAAYAPVVWIAGGLLKGADVDDLVRRHAGRLRAVGAARPDRARHRRGAGATRARMSPSSRWRARTLRSWTSVVARPRPARRPGDTVLLAPAAASMDLFRDYAARGDAFAAAVRRLGQGRR